MDKIFSFIVNGTSCGMFHDSTEAEMVYPKATKLQYQLDFMTRYDIIEVSWSETEKDGGTINTYTITTRVPSHVVNLVLHG